MSNQVFMMVKPEHVPFVWEHVYKKLEPSVINSNGRDSIDGVLKAIIEKRSQLWIYANTENNKITAAMTTAITDYNNSRWLSLNHVGGRGSGIIDNAGDPLELLNGFAVENGCVGIEGFCSPFWDKFLDKLGFKKVLTVVEREVHYG